MKFVLALTSLFVSTMAANIKAGDGIKADSKSGLNLLSKARRVNDAEEVDVTWVAGYDIKFQGCHHVAQWNEEVEDEDDVRVETLRLVRFRLCPTGFCSSESGAGCSSGYGDYIVDMNTYVASYLEMKEEYQEAQCEAYLEAGYCTCEDNGDDAYDEEACQNTCFAAAGMSYCAVDEDALDVNDYLECGAYEPAEAEYYGRRKLAEEEVQYFLGPYCADQGGEIKLGLFNDDTCTTFADSFGYGGRTTFNTISNGATLPYSESSLIDATCWSCLAEDDNDDNAAAAEPSEFCGGIYEIAGKCEAELSEAYNDNACNYLEGIQMTRTNGIIISGSGSKNKVAGAFIGIFAVSFILLGSYVYYLKTKLDRGRINLSD